MMTCPECGSVASHVVRTKRVDLSWISFVRRQRECTHCGHRWVTVEVPLDFVKNVEAAIDLALNE